MAAPIYFFPAVRIADLAPPDASGLSGVILKRYGLEHTLGDVKVSQLCRQELATAAGPGGKSGTMICTNTAGEPPVRFGYHVDFQEWTKVRSDPELWVGVDKEHRPTPADLARPNLLDGHSVTLADGNTYQVPILESPDASRPSLPLDMYHDETGAFTVKVHGDYAALVDTAQEVRAFLMETGEETGETSQTMAFSRILYHCMEILGANYRYGTMEQPVLRLVNTGRSTWNRVFEAALDVPFILEVLEAGKKNEFLHPSAISDTLPGSADSDPGTGPATANST